MTTTRWSALVPAGDHPPEVVGDQDDPHAQLALDRAVEQAAGSLGQDRYVKRRRRLVGDQQFWGATAGERHRDHHPLADCHSWWTDSRGNVPSGGEGRRGRGPAARLSPSARRHALAAAGAPIRRSACRSSSWSSICTPPDIRKKTIPMLLPRTLRISESESGTRSKWPSNRIWPEWMYPRAGSSRMISFVTSRPSSFRNRTRRRCRPSRPSPRQSQPVDRVDHALALPDLGTEIHHLEQLGHRLLLLEPDVEGVRRSASPMKLKATTARTMAISAG